MQTPCDDLGQCPHNAQGGYDCRNYCGLGVDESSYLEEEYEEEYDQVSEEEAWQQTLVDIQKAPCPKCGCTERHTDYNQHIGSGDYSTFDTVCNGCGYVILSLMD